MIFCWRFLYQNFQSPGQIVYLLQKFEVTAYFSQKCIFSIAMSWPSFFILLSFLNGLSYRCQIGLKWKIIWCRFRKWKEKNRFSAIYHTKHGGSWLFMEIFCKNWFPGHKIHPRYQTIDLSQVISKTRLNYLPFETNLASVAQTV